MTCRELVELITDYFDGALDDDARDEFDAHLVICPGCVFYLEQMRTTIRVTGMLTPESLSEEASTELLSAFRSWRT